MSTELSLYSECCFYHFIKVVNEPIEYYFPSFTTDSHVNVWVFNNLCIGCITVNVCLLSYM